MLGKLIKYEFKATCKFMLLIYGLLIAMAAIIGVSNAVDLMDLLEFIDDKFSMAGSVLYVFVIIVIALFIIVNVVVFSGMFFYAIKRFKDNLLGDEGYLMHTLPVKIGDHIIAKCIVSVTWTILSIFAAAIAYFILLVVGNGTEVIEDIARGLRNIFEYDIALADFALVAFEFVIFSVISIARSYMHIYASMAAGFSANKYRVAISIGVHVLISMVVNTIASVATNLASILYFASEAIMPATHHIMFWGGAAFEAASLVALYFVTCYFMDKKLNLQ